MINLPLSLSLEDFEALSALSALVAHNHRRIVRIRLPPTAQSELFL